MITQIEGTIERLHQVLDKLPARSDHWRDDARNYDWTVKAILADALEEAGSILAPGYRWMVMHRKRPLQCDKRWRWFVDLCGDVVIDPNSDLPEEVFQRLGSSREGLYMTDRQAADDAVALVIAKMIDEGIEI